MTELMDPTLAARALSAATEITSTALSGDDPGAVLDTVVARAAELADADLGLAMVSAEDGRVVVEAAHYATAHPVAAAGVDLTGDDPTGDDAVGEEPVGPTADGAASSAGESGESLRGLALPSDSAAGRVARGGEPVASADFTVDPRTAPYVPAELHGYGPFAAA